MRKEPGVVVIATGSAASIVLPDYLAALVPVLAGPLTVLLTWSAARFVRPEAVAWFADEVLTGAESDLNPIRLALTAEAIVVLPASGNTIASAALGLMNTPATTAIAASPSPCLFFPQVHPVVWHKPVMAAHAAGLRAAGHTLVEPEEAEGFELSRRAPGKTLLMPTAEDAAGIVREWLAARESTPQPARSMA